MSRRAVHALYYLAHTAKSLLWTASDLVTIYALVALGGVDPDRAGWLFLGGLAANAFADLAVGWWLDRRPAAAPGLAMAGLAVASASFPATMTADVAGSAGLLAATLAFRIGYAAFDVPHNALLGRLADTAGAATQLARGRTVGTGAAALIVGVGLNAVGTPAALARLLWGLAAIAAIGGGALIPLLRRRAAPGGVAPLPPRGAGLPWWFLIGGLVGTVALGILAKAMLHLPASMLHPAAGTTVVLLTIGRTTAALLPIGFVDAARGSRLLGAVYLGGAVATALLLPIGGWPVSLALGLLAGTTNLLGWALLPLMASRQRSFGLYTMTGKLGLGMAGVGMTAALRGQSVFDAGRLAIVVTGAVAGCALAALLLGRRGLTGRAGRGAVAA